jgi:hypothetical protein
VIVECSAAHPGVGTGAKMISREKALQDLVEFRVMPEKSKSDLVEFTWDSEEELVELKRQHIVAVLQQFITGEVSGGEVEEWANLIECREDIRYDEVADVIHTLANPAITQELTQAIAEKIINDLEKSG